MTTSHGRRVMCQRGREICSRIALTAAALGIVVVIGLTYWLPGAPSLEGELHE